MNTVKIKSHNETQGEFVVINECDFNEDLHQLYGKKAPASTEKVEDKKVGGEKKPAKPKKK